jgi:hypothetical protein
VIQQPALDSNSLVSVSVAGFHTVTTRILSDGHVVIHTRDVTSLHSSVVSEEHCARMRGKSLEMSLFSLRSVRYVTVTLPDNCGAKDGCVCHRYFVQSKTESLERHGHRTAIDDATFWCDDQGVVLTIDALRIE